MVDKLDCDGHAIALARIAEEAERRTGALDLSGLGLTFLPPGLFDLHHLRALDLGGERYGEKKPNAIAADLEKLRRLAGLEVLSIAASDVRELGFVSGLIALRSINCSNTVIASLEPLSRLTTLESIDCSSTSVASLEPLAGLATLRSLNCESTKVTSLIPFAN